MSAQRAGLLEEGAQVALSSGWPSPTSSDSSVGTKAADLSFPSELAQGGSSGRWALRCELRKAVYHLVTTTQLPARRSTQCRFSAHVEPLVGAELKRGMSSDKEGTPAKNAEKDRFVW